MRETIEQIESRGFAIHQSHVSRMVNGKARRAVL